MLFDLFQISIIPKQITIIMGFLSIVLDIIFLIRGYIQIVFETGEKLTSETCTGTIKKLPK